MNSNKGKPSRAARFLRVSVAGLTAIAAVAGGSSGCLDRPIAEQEPSTSNVFVTQFAQTAVDKIDLLFMIDNSQSMADKQLLLAEAVPRLVGRLLNPPCLDGAGNVVDTPASPSADCAQGGREFEPINDVHIGVVSSSLGGAGGPFCSAANDQFNETQADMAHLIGSVRDVPNNGQGFLAWDNRPSGPAAGATNDLGAITTQFADHVRLTGEVGCGFEASLEAWYRFLIDPTPYATVEVSGSYGTPTGVDDALLAQRNAFLRGDSLVAIIMLSDENDCSIQAAGYGNLVATFNREGRGVFRMAPGTTACDANPNDPCCVSCLSSSFPAGCGDEATLCPNGKELPQGQDESNLRCYDQKRRFGMDLLYPTTRYSVGLTKMQICPNSSFPDADCDCTEATRLGMACNPGAPVNNPLYELRGAISGRDPSLVFLAGIVGVPWQDIATAETVDSATELRYKNAIDIDWPAILGQPRDHVPPQNQHMVEAITPRPDLPGPDGTGPTADPIHGHEWNTSGRDLQYACIFPLPNPTDCAQVEAGRNCDCAPSVNRETGELTLDDVLAAKKPLCQDEGGNYGTVQYRAKAYPGLRQLEVLKDYRENSIVASVCPKFLGDSASTSYGYNPAVNAIVDRLKEKLGGRCLPRRLDVDENGMVQCEVVEALATGACDCNPAKGRVSLEDNPGLVGAVKESLRENQACDTDSTPACENVCMCGITQYSLANPSDRDECLKTAGDSINVSTPGYCYIDAMDPDDVLGNAELVANCEPSQKRLLRFVGDDTPARGSVTFIACSGERIR